MFPVTETQATQTIEPHRINALLDMGVKPVYRLTTASGRSIKTTANHPYLKRTENRVQSTENSEWVKVSRLKLGDEIACPADGFGGYGVAPREINGRALFVCADQHTLAEKLSRGLSKERLALSFLTPLFSRLNKKTSHNGYKADNRQYDSHEPGEFFKKITCQTYCKNRSPQINNNLGYKFSSRIVYNFHIYTNRLYHMVDRMSNSIFKQATAYAQTVSESAILWDPIRKSPHTIAVGELGGRSASNRAGSDVLWDKIASIDYIGYEHVYDIEVDGTHNFIANGIFAHNTYTGKQPDMSNQKPGGPAPGAGQQVGGSQNRNIPSGTHEEDYTDTTGAALSMGERKGAVSQVVSRPGGVDFRALPVVMQAPAEGGAPGLPIGRGAYSVDAVVELSKEWAQIQRMLEAGIRPSTDRIKEYAEACLAKHDFDGEIDKILSCIADILRLEEECCSATEPELRQLLVLLESGQPAEDTAAQLRKIQPLPKEPKNKKN